jgi:ABC-type nitrate/sulfonate/bicarbonate transport system permease component
MNMDITMRSKSGAARSSPLLSRINTSQRFRWGAGSVITFLLLWEVVGALHILPPEYISQPSRVVAAGFELLSEGGFFYDVYISMVEIVVGFVFASVVGLLIGVMMGRNRIVSGLFDPLVMALYATPRVALIPLFVVWFGVGIESKIFVVFAGALFPILVNTLTGIRQVDPILLRASRSFGATGLQTFTKVLLPGALPAMVTGLRLGWGRGILGMVIGEMYTSMAGLGHLISGAGDAMRTDHLFFLIVVVASIGYVTTAAFQQLEHIVSPWRKEDTRL